MTGHNVIQHDRASSSRSWASCTMGSVWSRPRITIKGSFAEMTSFAAAILALPTGRARTEGIITHRFSLDEYGKALDALASHSSVSSVHKVVIGP